MKHFSLFVLRLSKGTRFVGGVTLACMMLLTVLDVILRYLGKPIAGTYELVSLAGAIVIGSSIPQSSIDNHNVSVEILVEVVSAPVRRTLAICTRLMGIGLFLILAYGLLAKANELNRAEEVSNVLRIPFCLMGYALGICAFVESLVLLSLLAEIFMGGAHHE
jgi:TRAP-type C4-dicarboxylate transport system permease small subunit